MSERLGALFRAVPEPQPLSPRELAEVRFRLAQLPKSRRESSRVREWTLVTAFVLLGASVASAGAGLLHVWKASRPPETRSALPVGSGAGGAAKATLRRTPARAPSASASSVAAPELAIVPEPTPDTPQRRSHAGFENEANDTLNAENKPVEPRALTLESALLARALTKLRRDRDPKAALVLFDQYAAEFPNGALRLDSRVARIDALLSLGRRSEALSELSNLPLDRVARSGELRLLRAELWAERDCQRALPDFQALLDGGAAGPLAERALHGRAACRLRVGDRARALADLRLYLDRYPTGAFAAEVRAALASSDSQ